MLQCPCHRQPPNRQGFLVPEHNRLRHRHPSPHPHHGWSTSFFPPSLPHYLIPFTLMRLQTEALGHWCSGGTSKVKITLSPKISGWGNVLPTSGVFSKLPQFGFLLLPNATHSDTGSGDSGLDYIQPKNLIQVQCFWAQNTRRCPSTWTLQYINNCKGGEI